MCSGPTNVCMYLCACVRACERASVRACVGILCIGARLRACLSSFYLLHSIFRLTVVQLLVPVTNTINSYCVQRRSALRHTLKHRCVSRSRPDELITRVAGIRENRGGICTSSINCKRASPKPKSGRKSSVEDVKSITSH